MNEGGREKSRSRDLSAAGPHRACFSTSPERLSSPKESTTWPDGVTHPTHRAAWEKKIFPKKTLEKSLEKKKPPNGPPLFFFGKMAPQKNDVPRLFSSLIVDAVSSTRNTSVFLESGNHYTETSCWAPQPR